MSTWFLDSELTVNLLIMYVVKCYGFFMMQIWGKYVMYQYNKIVILCAHIVNPVVCVVLNQTHVAKGCGRLVP